ncbi:uspA domain protein [Haloterrigena salina JCM 13891]|uniref:UspA domain protein n=1 Tax=Haloterrigena salina JCM 13891 TaxID=1227488 RepID=M0CQE6_9EURY|nr:universal stress protein [Haloterrigena salina]ELZ24617.1 uspA domain protein [Haloterrigena salina JCM 13891]
MKTILLCIDTDVERANEQVKSVTELPLETEQVRIVLYHVFRADDENADAENLKSVSEAIERLEEAGFTVEVAQSSGNAVRNILDQAAELDADVISLAGRKRSPTGKALFGSVTQDVILKSNRTVLLSTAE